MSQLRAQVDKLLSTASAGYFPQGAIAEVVLPSVGVKQKTGKLGKYGAAHLRLENSIKGGRGAYRRVEAIARETDNYSIDGHGLEGLVTQDDYDNVEQPFDAEKDETLGLTSLILIEKEKVLADSLANTAVLTQNTTLSGTSQLNDYTNSTPLSLFSDARAAVKSGCGALADTVIMSWEVLEKLRFHPAILDALGFKDNRPGGLTEAEIATALMVKRVLIGSMSYNSAKEGQATVLSPVWGKNIIFAVCPEKAQIQQVSLGYQINYANRVQRQVRKWAVNNPPDSTAVLVEDNYDFMLSNVGAAYLIKNAIA